MKHRKIKFTTICAYEGCKVVLPDTWQCPDVDESGLVLEEKGGCANHSCGYDIGFDLECRRLVKPGEKSCKEHRCVKEGCQNHSLHTSDLCYNHGCHVFGCQNDNEGPGTTLCARHALRTRGGLFGYDDGW